MISNDKEEQKQVYSFISSGSNGHKSTLMSAKKRFVRVYLHVDEKKPCVVNTKAMSFVGQGKTMHQLKAKYHRNVPTTSV